jgi:hypothetical protein
MNRSVRRAGKTRGTRLRRRRALRPTEARGWRGLFPEAYADFAQPILAAFAQVTTVTRESDVAQAVYRAATDTSGQLRFPAGVDAMALSFDLPQSEAGCKGGSALILACARAWPRATARSSLNKNSLRICAPTRGDLLSVGNSKRKRGAWAAVVRRWLAKRRRTRQAHSKPLGDELMAHERTRVEAALAESQRQRVWTEWRAARLGMPRSTLESKIRALKVDKHRFKGVHSRPSALGRLRPSARVRPRRYRPADLGVRCDGRSHSMPLDNWLCPKLCPNLVQARSFGSRREPRSNKKSGLKSLISGPFRNYRRP